MDCGVFHQQFPSHLLDGHVVGCETVVTEPEYLDRCNVVEEKMSHIHVHGINISDIITMIPLCSVYKASLNESVYRILAVIHAPLIISASPLFGLV